MPSEVLRGLESIETAINRRSLIFDGEKQIVRLGTRKKLP